MFEPERANIHAIENTNQKEKQPYKPKPKSIFKGLVRKNHR